MRIPTTAEFLAFFVTTGQLTSFSNQPGADLDSGELAQEGGPPPYLVGRGDTCNSIAERYHVPTYQLICQNYKINRYCNNLKFGESIWLQGDQGEDCPITFTVRQEGQNAQSLADQFHIPIEIFQGNNYCYNKDGSGTICPPFLPGKTVCTAPFPIMKLSKCPKCEKIVRDEF